MIKLFEMFAGYGGASFALKKVGIDFECVGYSEIDKYAIECFDNNFPNVKNYGDCKLINPNDLPDFDLLTGGFPCQSFSVAGKMKGEEDIRGTLFYDIIRIAEIKKPKYLLLENVKGLTCKKFKSTFDKILNELNRIGYKVYWKVLNSKDYGIPQSRARVWFVCFRKDIDIPFSFQFPEPVELKLFVKDILEEQVDNKYYLSEKLQERFIKYLEEKKYKSFLKENEVQKIIDNKGKQTKRIDGCSFTLTGSGRNCGNNQAIAESSVVAMRKAERNTPKELREYDGQQLEPREDGCSNTISTVQKDNLVYDRKGFDSKTKGFRESELSPTLLNGMGTGGNNVPMINAKISPCLTQELSHTTGNFTKNWINKGFLRRLTPKECFRLMGFLNDEINLDGLSDTQRYKLAGNGWEINVASKILRNMFKQC